MGKGEGSAGARVAARIDLGELALARGKRPKVRCASKRSWSREKEKEFLSTLAETCNVTVAAAEAGISPSAAYDRRKSDARFRAGWGEAIAVAYHKLELILLERALNGTEKLVTRRDGSEERMREYPNQLALALLKMHRDTAVEAETEVPPEEVAEIRARLLKKLERLRRRGAADDCGEEECWPRA